MGQSFATMSAKPDVFQQVFGLSLASNLVYTCTGTQDALQKKLAKALPANLSTIGHGWEVVWGPVVWKDIADRYISDTAQGNAWFIAKNDSVTFDDGKQYPTYVIAIAGTSGRYDWIAEDGEILSLINIKQWATSSLAAEPASHLRFWSDETQPLISSGFGGAVYELVNNAPPEGSPGYPYTLPQFLQSIKAPSTGLAPKLVVTGHSLGGALSPLLAYALVQAKTLGPFTQQNVHVYPTAGPSPGNAAFRKAFSACFPSPNGTLTGYRYWNTNIVNQTDVVPCAYCSNPAYAPQVLSSFLTMFGAIPIPEETKIAVGALQWAGGGVYVPLQASFFKSSIPLPTTDDTTWGVEAHKQHVDAYSWEILGVQTPTGVCPMTVQNDWARHPGLAQVAKESRKLTERDSILADLRL